LYTFQTSNIVNFLINFTFFTATYGSISATFATLMLHPLQHYVQLCVV